MVRAIYLFVFLLIMSANVMATHNRAGEITYSHVEGLTYEVLITTYTKASALADRPSLYILWGDENGADMDSLERESVNIIVGDIQVNTYRGTHTYGGPGVFELKMEDPNRNEGVLNMVGSVDTPFAIRSLLIIDPQAGHNNSVKLLNPATENACLNREWIHNPAAYDEDGDLLTFSLVSCRGFNGDPIPTYQYPNEVSLADDLFIIDEFSGDVTWNSPQIVGEYNIAIRVEEWRYVDGELRKVGEVVRDMQIDVQVCNNQPPEISDIQDTCIVAGSFLTLYINATDPDGDNLTLSAVGGPISEVLHPAIFTNLGGGIGEFAWAPTCTEVRLLPYQVVFKAKDQGTAVPLTDLETVYIRVVAPALEDVVAEPIGNTVLLSWSGGSCSDELASWQQEYGFHDIYRRLGSEPWSPTSCETGVPDELGFQLIASQADLGETTYVDEDLLSFGATYCYRIVMRFEDESESLSSDEVCATIVKDVPVITHADVAFTDEVGEVNVGWSPPTEMDTLIFPKPYTYIVFRNLVGITEEIASGISDTSYVDEAVDTRTQATGYFIEAWSETSDGPALVGGSSSADTPLLLLTPGDNQIGVEVIVSVPWNMTAFYIERKAPGELSFTPYDTAFTAMFLDTGLVNTQEYCYRVKTQGYYDSNGTEDPLFNYSQEACSIPYDFSPPCPPVLQVDDDCIEEVDYLSWGGASLCADDVMGYSLYWAPFEGDTLQLYATFNHETGFSLDSTFIFNEGGVEGTIAGCFAVTASDSLLPGPGGVLRQNESVFSNVVCVDNCPFYFLPNIFTPNGDEMNDTFRPFPWKFIESIDLRVHNRWGVEVFSTEDVDINWDGRHFESRQVLPDGVYFYTLTAYTIRLSGIVPERFSGEITLHGSKAID